MLTGGMEGSGRARGCGSATFTYPSVGLDLRGVVSLSEDDTGQAGLGQPNIVLIAEVVDHGDLLSDDDVDRTISTYLTVRLAILAIEFEGQLIGRQLGNRPSGVFPAPLAAFQRSFTKHRVFYR